MIKISENETAKTNEKLTYEAALHYIGQVEKAILNNPPVKAIAIILNIAKQIRGQADEDALIAEYFLEEEEK
jgi:hypothetical protein